MDNPAPTTCNDPALVREARKGNDQAFAVLINRYRSFIFGTAWAALQDYDDAEDVAQESFVLAYRRLSDLKEPGKFPSWLHSIAMNVARKWLGKRVLEQRRFERLKASPEMVTEHPEAARESKFWQNE